MADASGGHVVVLNLLKFRAKAAYPDGRATSLTGRQAYDLMRRRCKMVEYPSASAFAAVVTSPEVAEIGVHRAAGLDGQLLIRVAPLAL